MVKKSLKNNIVNSLEERVRLFSFRGWFKGHWKIIIVLVLFVGAAYANSLKSDFVSDDTRSILNNASLDKIDYLFSQKRPTLHTTLNFFINKIAGRVPLYFRLVNVSFHTAAVLAAYLLFSILIGPRVSFFTAAIFAVHPVGIESVAWISGATYTQYAFFALLAIIFYALSYKDKKFLKFSVIAFLFSLFSSDMALVLPLILLAFVLAFANLRKDWKRLIVFFAIVVVFLLSFFWLISYRLTSFQQDFYQESQKLNPLLQIPIAITSYLELIFWPKGLTLYHSEMTFSRAEYLTRLVLFIILLGIFIYSFRKSRRVFFGLSLFLISLLPTLTPLGITWIVAERYVYLGSVGIFMIFSLLLNRLSGRRSWKIFINIFFLLIIIALLARTIIRNIDWRNEDNLWIATGETSPSSPNTHNNLGDVYGRRGNAEKSIEEFKKAIQLKPNYADAYHNLANTYQEMGMVDEAIENYKKAIQFNPWLWQSYQNLGALYFNKGDSALAEEYFRKVIEINPVDSYAYTNLGILYLVSGRKKEAGERFQEALRLEPGNQRAQEGLNLSK